MIRTLAVAMTLALPAHAQSVPMGDWVGLGFQNGESWTMELQIVQGGARVDYPGLECGGVWQFLPEHSDLRATEWLTYGHEFCLDELHVTIQHSKGDALMIRWFDEIGAEIAHAPLQRVGGKQNKSRKN